MIENSITSEIIGSAISVHNALGPGLLESAYQECLYYDLVQKGFHVSKELPMPITYREVTLDHGYRIDLLVENKIVIEVKTVESFMDIHLAQILTYMRLGGFKLGLLLNFHVTSMKDGIKRVVN
jgi:GxxExxY protein